MFGVPQEVLVVLCAFAPLFSKPVWSHARILAIGAILSTGKRTVTSALRVMGLRDVVLGSQYPLPWLLVFEWTQVCTISPS